ncbi:hypothetical protein PFICI_00945 [Pestalotiopsis fici W106-1]|uniref:SpvB-domain-containing protein n=1 Tax=Pestalotiopsis fici (strain W106-1 / CGMCC3.15140) TaxID=1229662 RepID=W3XNM8_PESFW|nr:uncharacterized protein PFICI_00945 [Pestalotiopsis fici W106-1]ETS87117.1 hypothetical protein PFICI_00945 [Pestalotiopsis fici W106-1]
MDESVRSRVQPAAPTKRSGLNGNPAAEPRDKATNNGSAKPSSRVPSIEKVDVAAASTGKGGGALRSIDQKFEVNPCNGTLALSLTLPVTSGRDECQPTLSLSYNSGSGNGPFGIGWSLSLGSITRKTTQGIPQYENSDTFLLSGLDDLVEDGCAFAYSGSLGKYTVQRYRSRVEIGGAAMRIEKFTHHLDQHDVFWRTISPANVTSLYGRQDQSRIMDVAGDGGPPRIFTWLLCEVYDPNGNAMLLTYLEENDEGVRGTDGCLPVHEISRNPSARTRARYIKSIKYGNISVARDLTTWQITPLPADHKWMFEVVFDYGDHDSEIPTSEPAMPWPVRKDAFSHYSSGFEIRTYRLCKRILLFHHFEDKLPRKDYLVSSYSLQYDENAAGSLLRSLMTAGHVWDEERDIYQQQDLAPHTFAYSNAASLDSLHLQTMKPDCLQGLLTSNEKFQTRWVDLNGEGAPGLLVQRDGAWYYQRNENALDMGGLSDGGGETESSEDSDDGEPAESPKADRDFGSVRVVNAFPAVGDYSTSYLEDLDGNGQQDLVICDLKGRAAGYFECDSTDEWQSFREFPTCLTFNINGDSVHRLDLTGNGLSDVLYRAEDGFIWFPSLGKEGYDLERRCQGIDAIDMFVSHDKRSAVFLTDVTGDGLTDIVKVSNGSISYCPNLGHGRFGSELSMSNPPLFDSDDQFSFERLNLLDIDGSGTTDLLYLTADGGINIYFNQCGNEWSDKLSLDCFVRTDNLSSVFTLDLLGNGTSCLCWAGPDAAAPDELVISYLDLTGGVKPHLLKFWSTGTGLTTSIKYTPSTRFYLQDERQGRPWKTKLPFPVHTVSRIVERDEIASSTHTTRFRYHDGYYDGAEREFRGFGAVEKWETDNFTVTRGKKSLQTPTTYTKMFYHTGAVEMGLAPSGPDMWSEARLASVIVPSLKSDQWYEAYRALKGSLLRSEVYGADGSDAADVPYIIRETSFDVKLVIPDAERRAETSSPLVYRVEPRESLTEHLERLRDESRLVHELALETNTYGDTTKSLIVQYGRQQSSLTTPQSCAAQKKSHITYTEKTFTNAIDDNVDVDNYYKPMPSSTGIFHLEDSPVANRFLDIEEIRYRGIAVLGGSKHMGHMTRTYYRSADLKRPLRLHAVETFSRLDRECVFAMDQTIIDSLSAQKDVTFRKVSPRNLLYKSGGYVQLDRDKCAWIPSAEALWDIKGKSDSGNDYDADETLRAARKSFFIPKRSRDAFGHVSEVIMDEFQRLPIETIDPAGNRMRAVYDYRVMQPTILTDVNGNRVSVVYDGLGDTAAVAQMGKSGEALGDSVEDIPSVLSDEDLLAFMKGASREMAMRLVGKAGSRTISSRKRLKLSVSGSSPVELPTFRLNLSRTSHAISPDAGTGDVTVEVFYYDGRGSVSQKLNLTHWPTSDNKEHEWCLSKSVVNDSSGKAVIVSKPFFSSDHVWKPLLDHTGHLTFSFRDALGRNVGILQPDHTWTKQCFTPWSSTSYDAGDTCLVTDARTDPDVGFHFQRMSTELFMPSWYELRVQSEDKRLQQSAHKSAQYANKPSTTHHDSRGKVIEAVEMGDAYTRTLCSAYDVFGYKTAQYDALNRLVESYDLYLLDQPLVRRNMESGAIVTIITSAGQPLLTSDSAGRQTRFVYDSLGRKTDTWVMQNCEAAQEVLWSQYVYGEATLDPEPNNLRGQVFEIRDQSGIRRNTSFDFKGNCLSFDNHLAVEYQTMLNWRGHVPVEEKAYTTRNVFDALNRNTMMCDATGRVHVRTFDLVGNTQTLSSFVAPSDDNSQSPFVPMPPKSGTDYHIAKAMYAADGQPLRVDFGNKSHSTYTYDESTGQVVRRRTWRDDRAVLEDLTTTYDCLCRISCSQDRAQQTLFFRNKMVEPLKEFFYDTFGRLSRATGRETLDAGGNTTRSLRQVSASSALVTQSLGPGQSSDVCDYVEHYVYDDADNLRLVRHEVLDKSLQGWTRFYTYKEPSLLESSQYSNRLSQTRIGSLIERYGYDGANGQVGCMTHMTGFSRLQWDHRNKLQCTARQKVNAGVPEMTWYVYDDSGKRVRKVTTRASGGSGDNTKSTKRKETIYLDSLEIYHVYKQDGSTIKTTTNTSTVGSSTDPEVPAVVSIEDVKVATDSVEIDSDDCGDSDDDDSKRKPRPEPNKPLLRYHVNTNLETDDKGQIISYEEYTPFGVSVLLMCRAQIEAPRRYRFASYHRDHETGLYACGARYYASWLGRWTSPDPLGMVDGPNLYAYVSNEPVNYFDPGGTMRRASGGAPLPTAPTSAPNGINGRVAGPPNNNQVTISPEERARIHQQYQRNQQAQKSYIRQGMENIWKNKKEYAIKGAGAGAGYYFGGPLGGYLGTAVKTAFSWGAGHIAGRVTQGRQDVENMNNGADLYRSALADGPNRSADYTVLEIPDPVEQDDQANSNLEVGPREDQYPGANVRAEGANAPEQLRAHTILDIPSDANANNAAQRNVAESHRINNAVRQDKPDP